MRKVSIKKLLGVIGITLAFVTVFIGGIFYVQHAESERSMKEILQKKNMIEEIAVEPEYDIVTTAGTIRVKLYRKTPEHLKNFDRLVQEHFYDSLLFHRVIDGFMIQTGDPLTKDMANVERFGQGGPGYSLPAEFVPEYRHKKGALAAARKGDRANPKKSSSGSQFYIVQNEANCEHLDGEYTVFGETVDGMNVIDDIAAFPTDAHDRPIFDVRILTIRRVEDTPVSTAVDTLRARLDSTQLRKLDSLAQAAGIDTTDLQQMDSLARAAGISTGHLRKLDSLARSMDPDAPKKIGKKLMKGKKAIEKLQGLENMAIEKH